MFNYKKIIVIGCSGAGKSTFSRKLHEITKIDLYHLDTLYWNSDGTHIQRSELIEKQEKIISGERWIIDGNFKRTLEMRIKNADLIFFFDLPTQVCINGAVNRGESPEIPCKLPVNDELIDFIKNFNTDVKPKILELFKKYKSNVITFNSHKQADDFIDEINRQNTVDLTLKTDKGIFNHRVAAVIINDNKLLAQKNTADNSYYLVGGRVSFGESSEVALVREIKEELEILITDYNPLWVNECFFIDNGRKFHEIGIYYLVDISNTDFCRSEAVFEINKANRINTYEWLDINNLESIKLYPEFIKEEIKNPNKDLKLIITNEVEQ